MQTIYSTGQAARILGVKAPPNHVCHRQPPGSRIGVPFPQQKVFDAANIRQLADHFGVEITVDEAGLNGKPPTLSP